MNVGEALEETVLVTGIGSESTANQVGTEPRDFGNFNMYQTWLSIVVWWMQVRGTWGSHGPNLGKVGSNPDRTPEGARPFHKDPTDSLGGLDAWQSQM